MCSIQETHLNPSHRFFIRGYSIYRRDRPTGIKGGVLTLDKHDIPAAVVEETKDGDLEFITIKTALQGEDLYITNCYSPPTSKLDLHKMTIQKENHIIVGDFNGHSPAWGYMDTDARGEEIQDWMIDHDLVLINKPNDRPTCYSRAWKSTSTPDIATAMENIQKRTVRIVQNQLGGSDHLPISIYIADMKKSTEYCRKKASWNFKKADWKKFENEAEKSCNINLTEDLNKNVKLYSEAILEAAKNSIPRGFRKDYKPYWSPNLERLHVWTSNRRKNQHGRKSRK